MDISSYNPRALILSSGTANRIALSLLLKSSGVIDIEQPVFKSEQKVHSLLISRFRENLLKKNDENRDLVLINFRTPGEYQRLLEGLPKEIMGKMTRWRMEGVEFSGSDISAFIDTFLIVHFVHGADFVYRIENNEKVSINFGEMNTSELLTCANLFGELGISISTYFEKSDEPTPGILREYVEALKRGKEVAVEKITSGELKREDIPQVIDQVIRSTSLQKRVDSMKERFIIDVEHFFGDAEKRRSVGKKRVDIVESADIFKQYLQLKEEALKKRAEKQYAEMEKILQKAIELLEGGGDSGQKSLLETYVDLSKSQIQQKKYVSAQRNASKAVKIGREAPSPKRLMGECQFGQAVDALKKGDYDEAESFLARADSYIQESFRLAQKVNDESEINEKEIALSLSEFEEETRKVAESDPRAQELIGKNRAFNAMTETAHSLKARHKLVKEGEISPDVGPDEIANLLDGANELLTNIVDTGACMKSLRKIFSANAPETANQLVAVGGLVDRILKNQKDESRFERALVFVRHASGYDLPQKGHVEKKFLELNRAIAKERIQAGVKLMASVFREEDVSPDSVLQKAKINFQKALHQDNEIVGDVVAMACDEIQVIQSDFSPSHAIKLIDALLSIELDEDGGNFFKRLEVKREELKSIQVKAVSLAKKAVELVLLKKLNEARSVYEHGTRLDEAQAFRTVTRSARKYRVDGNIREANSVYSWIARVDRNETDLQYINVAWCCLLLGDKNRARTFIEGAIKLNAKVMAEAESLDPSFKNSEVMRFYKEDIVNSGDGAGRTPALSIDLVIKVVMEVSHALSAKDTEKAYTVTRSLIKKDPQAFQRLVKIKPQVKKLPAYSFYLRNFRSPKPAGQPGGMSKESINIMVNALKLFSAGNKKAAVTSVIGALRKDPEILVKACAKYSAFKKSALMSFYFLNKEKVSKVLGFVPKP